MTDDNLTVQSLLDLNPPPDAVKTRPGPGGRPLTYIPAYSSVQMANDIFGYDGWHFNLIELSVDYMDVDSSGRCSSGVCAHVKVTVGSTVREDVGYGSVQNMKTKGEALETARKQAVTDALKRALRLFGHVFGACSDESFCKEISTVSKRRPFIKREYFTHDVSKKWKQRRERGNRALGPFSATGNVSFNDQLFPAPSDSSVAGTEDKSPSEHMKRKPLAATVAEEIPIPAIHHPSPTADKASGDPDVADGHDEGFLAAEDNEFDLINSQDFFDDNTLIDTAIDNK